MRKHERPLFTHGRIEFIVQPVGILVDELVFDLAVGKRFEIFIVCKPIEGVGLDTHKIPGDVGRFDFQEGHVPEILDRRNDSALVNGEKRLDELFLDVDLGGWVQ